MPSLNFQKQFVQQIREGRKCQTIRSLRKVLFKTGDLLYLYTGMRTKNCTKLGEAKASEVLPVLINKWRIEVDGKTLTHRECDEFAKEDGFEDWVKMKVWFLNNHGFPFSGQLIKWTKLINN